MLCFRDMTFCSGPCATKECPRQFDAAQQAAADRWWGEPGAPVAFSDFRKECPQYAAPAPDEASQ